MSHEAPRTSTSANHEHTAEAHGHAASHEGREQFDALIEAAWDRVGHNEQLNHEINNEVARAIDDAEDIRKANKKADRPFMISVKVGNAVKPNSLPVALSVRRGRVHLQKGIEKSIEQADELERLKKEEKSSIKARRSPNAKGVPTSQKMRRLARKELEARAKASKLESKKDYLDRVVAGGPGLQWNEDESRQIKGYKDLVADVANVNELVVARQQTRKRLDEMQQQIRDGSLSSTDSIYRTLLQESASWGDESDEDYQARLQSEARENYRAWHVGNEEKTDSEKYKEAQAELENRLEITSKLAKAKTDDPESYAKLIKEVSSWKPINELLEDRLGHDVNDFKIWIMDNAREEIENKLDENRKNLDEEGDKLEEGLSSIQSHRDARLAAYQLAKDSGSLSTQEEHEYAQELQKLDQDIIKLEELLDKNAVSTKENMKQLQAVMNWTPDIYDYMPQEIRDIWIGISKNAPEASRNYIRQTRSIGL